MSTEPNELAAEIESAVKQYDALVEACAQKDAEIARLKEYGEQKSIALQVKDQRIKELQAQVEQAREDRNRAGMVERSKYLPRLAAMTALLDRVPHWRNVTGDCKLVTALGCASDCPACAWAKLKMSVCV